MISALYFSPATNVDGSVVVPFFVHFTVAVVEISDDPLPLTVAVVTGVSPVTGSVTLISILSII